MPIQRIDYTRVNGGGTKEPKTTAKSAPLPVPGLGYGDDFGLRNVTARQMPL